MRRFWLIIALVALSGCATVYEDRYVYYGDPGYGGDYYYDRAPVGRVSFDAGYGYGYGFSAYDSIFWGLHHSYLDPYWYPGFYYGVTYFPSYYGWSSWYAGDYWRWRNFHPYSPYYGSYWDHYYAWTPRHRYRHGGFRDNHGDPQRFGSARNAAERMAHLGRAESRLSQRRAWAEGNGAAAAPGRSDGYGRGDIDRSRVGASQRGIAGRDNQPWRSHDGTLRSRGYVPDNRRSPDMIGLRGEAGGFLRGRPARGIADDAFGGRTPESRRFGNATALPDGRQPSIRADYPSIGDRSRASGGRAMPQFDQQMRVPPSREFRQGMPSRSFERPPMRSGGDGPSMRSSHGSGRSSAGSRESSRGRAQR